MLPFVRIRSAEESDAAGIIAILNPIIEAGCYTAMDTTLSLEEQLAYMRVFPQKGVFHVAICTNTGVLVGLQSVEPLSTARTMQHVGDISSFVALDAHRGGIGQALFQATFASAYQVGFRKLCAHVRGDNSQALAFYQSQGFSVVGTARKQLYLQGRYIDQIWLEMWLDSSR